VSQQNEPSHPCTHRHLYNKIVIFLLLSSSPQPGPKLWPPRLIYQQTSRQSNQARKNKLFSLNYEHEGKCKAYLNFFESLVTKVTQYRDHIHLLLWLLFFSFWGFTHRYHHWLWTLWALLAHRVGFKWIRPTTRNWALHLRQPYVSTTLTNFEVRRS